MKYPSKYKKSALAFSYNVRLTRVRACVCVCVWGGVEPGFNDIHLYDSSPIESDILWYQLIHHC
jgi:hypothetical protein